MIVRLRPRRQGLQRGPPHTDTVQRSADEIWAEWYEPLLSFIDDNRALIGAFAYINARWDDQPMWGRRMPAATGAIRASRTCG
ncbi:MAG TPA: hypothetical protein PKE27_23100 [Povalibacter sp.]|uniref:hypothetical protein n=1 Tax=Povalibacter sp. TaxID=1962978 RepID=UPI002C68F2FD|nr:hypothetical protein [Povalibacter sp.]HMN47479.1 hypothetical protein [Povalibacter sp.]